MAAFISTYTLQMPRWLEELRYYDLYNIRSRRLYDVVCEVLHLTLKYFSKKIPLQNCNEIEREREGETKSLLRKWHSSVRVRWQCSPGTLSNLPNNTFDNNTQWSRNLKRCQEDSSDLVTKVQLQSTKTSWADKVPDNFAILWIQLCSSSTIKRASTSISENYRNRVIK